ncbi:MAG: wax ester/triacylglycerol synthase family O-acyltransferase [Streptosporangiaceae bacterium]
MSQLTAVDATFLHIETGRSPAHIGGLGVVDTTLCADGRLTRADLVGLVRERAHLAGLLRHKLAGVPLGLDRPYWVDDPDFDPELHVHEVALPTPGDDEQLGEAIARIHERPLDRRRPLWEMHLLQGLSGGRAAVYAKVHHACVDGVLAAELLMALLDLQPESVTPPATAGTPLPGPGAWPMVGTGLARAVLHPVRTARSVLRTAPYLDQMPVVGTVPGVRELSTTIRTLLRRENPARSEVRGAPATPFNATVSARRRFAFGSLPLDEVKTVRRALGISINDVVMAMCTTALRQWLIDHDGLPDQPLIAGVPVSLRRDGSCGGANALSVMFAPLPTHIEDPTQRVDAVRDGMRKVKRRFAASSGTWLEEISGLVPAPVSGIVTRLALRMAPSISPLNLIISNVAGPQMPLYLRGARVLTYYPASVISDVTGGVNITVFTYNGNLDIGIIACRDLVPDVWDLIGHLRDALTELVKLSSVDLPGAGPPTPRAGP